MALQKKVYLPRSTVNYAALRAVFQYAEEQNISFGKALERFLLESDGFNSALETLAKDAEWFGKDVEELKESV